MWRTPGPAELAETLLEEDMSEMSKDMEELIKEEEEGEE